MGVIVGADGVVTLGLIAAVPWAAFRALRRVPARRTTTEALDVGYVAAVVAVTLLSHWGMGMVSRSDLRYMVNLVPFRTVLTLAGPDTLTQAFRQLLGNIAMFVPLGLLLPLPNDRYRRVRRVVITAVMASVAIELAQLILHLLEVSARSVDVHDVILNTLGAVIGWAIWRLVSSWFRRLSTVG